MASFVIKEFVHGTMELTLQAHLDADPHGALHPGATLNLDRQLQLIHEDMRCQSAERYGSVACARNHQEAKGTIEAIWGNGTQLSEI